MSIKSHAKQIIKPSDENVTELYILRWTHNKVRTSRTLPLDYAQPFLKLRTVILDEILFIKSE